jgi:hypothetical protein
VSEEHVDLSRPPHEPLPPRWSWRECHGGWMAVGMVGGVEKHCGSAGHAWRLVAGFVPRPGVEMAAWRCDDTDGVAYYVAAPTLREAVQAYYLLDDVRESEDFEAGFEWEEVLEEKARGIVIRGDGEPDRDLWTLVRRCEEPTVVACSEWP